MDTRQLKYIMEIEKAGSISKAAENLFIGYLKSMVGQNAGYGYKYTCDIFSDIGIKPPLMLLGTEEANRIANEEEGKRIREYVNAEPGSHFIISAKAEKGWEFKKWTKDGSDFSTDDRVEIVVDEPVSYIAYFDTQLMMSFWMQQENSFVGGTGEILIGK